MCVCEVVLVIACGGTWAMEAPLSLLTSGWALLRYIRLKMEWSRLITHKLLVKAVPASRKARWSLPSAYLWDFQGVSISGYGLQVMVDFCSEYRPLDIPPWCSQDLPVSCRNLSKTRKKGPLGPAAPLENRARSLSRLDSYTHTLSVQKYTFYNIL